VKTTAQAFDVSKSLKIVFGVSGGLFLAALVLTFLFIRLNLHIQSAEGKVAGTFFREAVKGKRQTVQKEFLRISYSVDGREYSGEVMGAGHSTHGRVAVYFFPGWPSHAWFYHKSNFSLPICGLCLVISGCVAYFSWRDIRKGRAGAA